MSSTGSSDPLSGGYSHSSTSFSTTASTTTKCFVKRNGRTYLGMPNIPYPLPVDLSELHRQSLRTLLLIEYHGAPVCCPALKTKPPKRVLEIGCGPGFWSMMCHRYYKSRGYTDISFTGIDIAPLTNQGDEANSEMTDLDPDMDWKFYQHDVMTAPWPFPDETFDMVLNKDMTLAVALPKHPLFTDETMRVLKTGGILEIWETDHTVRKLGPHAPQMTDAQAAALEIGAYAIGLTTPLSEPLNPYLVEYNRWVSQALQQRQLMSNPCAVVNHYLYQESELLHEVASRRVAIPLGKICWERAGKDGKLCWDTKDASSSSSGKVGKGAGKETALKEVVLTKGQAALRQTALLTFIQEIQAEELMLREASGKSQDEWDLWFSKMTEDLMNEGGAKWGECLESGVWWCKKK